MLKLLSFSLVTQLVINGILFGTMYGIAAIGLSLIFGTMRIMFLAQGTMIIFFAYLCFLGIPPFRHRPLSLPRHRHPHMPSSSARPLYQGLFREAAAKEDKNISLLIAVGLMFFLEDLMTVGWGGTPRAISTAYTTVAFRPMGLDFPLHQAFGTPDVDPRGRGASCSSSRRRSSAWR